MCQIWGNSLSEPFHVNNGVRQGGILSPYLFNVYMDDLSQSLNCCKTGCLSGEIMINHMKYSKEHAILYNFKKSSVLICKNRATMHAPSPSFAVNDTVIGECSVQRLHGQH